MRRRGLARLVASVVCLYLIVTTCRAIIDLWRAGDKVTRREAEVATLERQKEDLLRQAVIASSEGYLEKVARDQLGMSKPGEEILIIPKELLNIEVKTASVDATPNWEKWVRLIF